MNAEPQPWEVWWAEVAYEDAPKEKKLRPVIVIEKGTVAVLSLKVTTHPPREEFWGEYALQKWREAGLHKPSTVRISKILNLRLSDFGEKIGVLHIVDIQIIGRYISAIYRH